MITARLAGSRVGAVMILIGSLGAARVAAQQITLVSPDNGSATVGINLTGQQVTFTVSSQSFTSSTRTLYVSCSGQVTSCSVPDMVTFVYSTNVAVTFSSLAAGSGSIVLTAQGSISQDQGSYNVTVGFPYSVAVTPDGATAPTRSANTGGYGEQFTVTNNGTQPNTFNFSCTGAGGVTCGTVPSPVSPAPNGGVANVSMPYSVGAPGTGTLTLTATGTNTSNAGSYSVPIVAFGVSVTPDGGAAPTRTPNTGGHSETFTVRNTGSATNTYSFSCSGTGGVTCGTLPAAVAVSPGFETAVNMPYSVGAPGTGTLNLTATGTNASDAGSYSVPIVSYGVAVTPDGGAAPTRAANTGGYSESFTVTNTGSASNTYSLTCSGAGGVTCGTPPPALTVGAGLQTTVSMPYSVGAPGSGTLTLTASGTNTSDAGSYAVPIATFGVSVTPDAQLAPTRFSSTIGYSATFTIVNTGSTSNTFTLACSATGGIGCGTLPPPVPLASGAQTSVTVPYGTSAAGTGTLTLTASGTNVSDQGSFTIPVAQTLSTVSGGVLTIDSRYLLQASVDNYDPSGRVTDVTDARGTATNYLYGGNVHGAFLIKVTRFHDGSGITDLVTDIDYGTDGLPASIKDEGGTRRRFSYDSYGRLRQIRNHDSVLVKAYGYTYSRTSAPGSTYQVASPNAVAESTFVQHTPTLQVLVSGGYIDGLGRAIQTVVQDGTNYHVSATQYDLLGRTWRMWKPYSRATAGYDASFATNATSFYNTYHSPSTTVPYVETLYRPDPLNRIKQVTPEYLVGSPSAVVVHGYDIDVSNRLQITQVTDEALKKTRQHTDVFGNTVRSILGAGAPESTVTQFSYNVVGQRLQTTDPRSLITTYGFNSRGLMTSRTSPDAGAVNSLHDQAGNLRFSQDANQAAAGQVYFTSYDFRGRPLKSGRGAATFAVLNAHIANSFEATEANWLVVRQYDTKPSTLIFPWSRFSTQIAPLTLTNVIGRLAAVASKSNGAWQVTLFSYDADGRIAKRYIYTEANGGASVLTALNTTVTYARDLRDAITQRAETIGTNYFYQWYDYDGRGMLSKTYAATTNAKPGTADVTDTYLATGQPQNYQFQGGPLVPIRYTIRGQTEQIADPTLAACPTCPFAARYVYLLNGVVDVAEFYNAGSPAAQKRYRYAFGLGAYDALNRLKGADFSSWNGSGWTTTDAYDLANIGYDRAGNLLTLQRYRETPTFVDNLTYTIAPSSNRLTQIADAVDGSPEPWDAEDGSFGYDANGNLTSAPAPYSITAVMYDPANLPLSVTRSGVTSTYRYDDAGQRITKQVSTGSTEVYVREGATVLGVFTMSGSTVASSYFNLLWNDRVVGRQTSAGVLSYYHADMLGSVRAVVSSAGAVLESSDFDPWGLAMPGRELVGATPVKERFTGKERDVETGLDYFGARFYMPALGRWASADPLSQDYPAWSPYNYVFNNPTVMVDPLGLEAYVVDCATSDKKCQKNADRFEKARQQALQSNDPNVQRAAQAYGDRGVDNGVVVSFADPGKGLEGTTTASLQPKDPNNPTEIEGKYQVVIRPDAAGKVETVAHEGTHVADAQEFVATITPDAYYDLSKNLTAYETELNAFRVTNSVLSAANKNSSFGCTGSPCVLGRGVQNPNPVINQILADQQLPYKVTSAAQGARLFPSIVTPNPPPKP